MIGDKLSDMKKLGEMRVNPSKQPSRVKTFTGYHRQILGRMAAALHAKGDKRGITLMELLVVLGVFSLAVTMTSAIFLQANAVQRRVLVVNAAQADLRFALEAMVREIRNGGIDYSFYEGGGGIQIPADRLVVINSFGQREEFFLETSPAICPEGISQCIAVRIDGGAAESLTSSSINVENLVFYISPSVDPFTIDDASGVYPADLQPTVTVAMTVRTNAIKAENILNLSAQTTATARTYAR